MLPTEAHQLARCLERRHIRVQIQSVQTGDGQGDLIVHNGGEAGGGHEGSSRKGGVEYPHRATPSCPTGRPAWVGPPATLVPSSVTAQPTRRFEGGAFARLHLWQGHQPTIHERSL